MQLTRRYYSAGLVLAVVFILLAELLWLPDPLRLGGMRWIEVINGLTYAAAAVPLLWAIGAARGLTRAERSRQALRYRRARWYRAIIGVRITVFVLSLAAAITILAVPKLLLLLFVLICAGVLFLFADMILTETAWLRREKQRFMPKRSLTTLLMTGLLLLLLLCPTDYEVKYPGLTMNLSHYAAVEGGSPSSSIDGVLVFVRTAFPVDWLYTAIFPHYELHKIEVERTPLDVAYAQVSAMKSDANEAASAIAMQRAGLGRGVKLAGVRVMSVLLNAPAAGLLRPDDQITRLEGRSITSLKDVAAVMEEVEPGQTVNVQVKRDGLSLQVAVTTRAASTDPLRPVLGITIQNDYTYDIPREVQYKSYIAHIGGPSHGAMLTLALLDQLTPGGITGGIPIAGTGTIEPDGRIGEVGGVRQKAYTVSRTKAEVFFVPASEEGEARIGAPNLNIVPVRTVEDMLKWLEQHKKD
ncbi:PDZ domain-containing protein [Paenibacillus sp. GCM10023252]|uniref:PDZ domain-containing protein n=1 Tax=Paenibacillus sp. GCM10023252 TaxID=3252649 RepID=UPI00361E8DE6